MPIVPPAPVRFSITTCWPIARDIVSAVTRATKSRPPPGAKGTMKRIGRLGQAWSTCPWARALGNPTTATHAAKARSMRQRRSILSMLFLPIFSWRPRHSRRHGGPRQLAAALQTRDDQVQQAESELRILEIQFL